MKSRYVRAFENMRCLSTTARRSMSFSIGLFSVERVKGVVLEDPAFPGVINQKQMDELTAQAKASPRLRMNRDLRNSPDDQSQRMLNAIEPGSPMPIHRHQYSSETVVCLRGRLVEEFYDDMERMCTDASELTPGGPNVAINTLQVSGTPFALWNPVPSSWNAKTVRMSRWGRRIYSVDIIVNQLLTAVRVVIM